ncbi:MAG: chromate transporter [Verrucomicrobiales bacterium]|jgi:chromate transporter
MPHSFAEIFLVFLRLGLTSFGGPMAHLGYFREAIVEKKKWLSDVAYADLVALCQFVPGPASSQVGLGIGLSAGGLRGALAAWLGFTMPSAIAMAALGIYAASGAGIPSGILHGLKILAVGVVAQAVLGMARGLCPDAKRATLAALAAGAILMAGNAWVQVLAIAAAALAGGFWLRGEAAAQKGEAGGQLSVPAGLKRFAPIALLVFVVLLVLAVALPGGLATSSYKAGSLVFGGGHVVLPLLEADMVPGVVDEDTFLAGYGAVQGVPGPLFTFASYIGGAAGGWGGAAVATLAIFLPSFLLIIGVLPYWSQLVTLPGVRAAVMAANAAVVGVLAAAFYNPVFTSAIKEPRDLAIAILTFVALTSWKVPSWVLVLVLGVLGSIFL